MKLSKLKKMLKPIVDVGYRTLDVKVPMGASGETVVTLKTLSATEDVEPQRRAAAYLTSRMEEDGLTGDDPIPRYVMLEYFDRFRAEVIARAIIAIDGEEIPNVIEDDEDFKRPKAEVLAKLILEGWPRASLTVLFSKYGDLVVSLAQDVDRFAGEALADIEAEIEATEKKLERLKEYRNSRAAGDSSKTAKQITELLNFDRTIQKEADEAIQGVEEIRRMRDENADIRIEDELELDEPAAEPPQPADREPLPPRQSVAPKVAPPPSLRGAAQREGMSSMGQPVPALDAQVITDRDLDTGPRKAKVDALPVGALNPHFRK